MLNGLLKYSLDNKLVPFVLAALVAGGGYYAFSNLAVEAFPDPTDTQVQVISLFPGQPTEEIERRVSLPLERALNGTPGLIRLRSISLFGLSFVTLTFADGVDPLPARQQVFERLHGVDGRRACPRAHGHADRRGLPLHRSDRAGRRRGRGRALRGP